MTRNLTFRASDRLLVFAPHPDDETIATGELIQLAIAAGAAVRVVFATDGDNNPWPQRWVERRWRIDAAARARWGARRRAEAQAALARLGVPADAARFLGWPDLGLTGLLERDDAAIEMIAAEASAFAPTHVAAPSLHDRHPDHGALRVIVELALRKARVSCECLGFVVHGRASDAGEWRLPRDAERHRRKIEALMAHTSQMQLSRERLLRWADQSETFEQAQQCGSIAVAPTTSLHVPLIPRYRFLRRHDLLIVLVDGDRIERSRVRLPRFVGSDVPRILARSVCSGRVTVELADGVLRIGLADSRGDVRGYIKLERTQPRVMIFDVESWHRIDDIAASREAAAHVEPVAVAQRVSL